MHLLGHSKTSVAALVVAMMLSSAVAPSVSADEPVSATTLAQRANALLDLSESEVVTLAFDRTPGATDEISLPFNSQMIVLDIAPHSIRAPSYAVKVQVADGSLVDVEPGPVRTVRGTIRDLGGVVIGSVTDAGLSALIEMRDGGRYWVEPLHGRVLDAEPVHHVLYAETSIIPGGGSCGADATTLPLHITDERPPVEESLAPCAGLPCLIELACDSDFEYFINHGSSVANVEAQINLVINTMNLQYERDVSMVYGITTIIVRTAEPDPYTTTDAGALLNQFTSHWIANHADIFPDQAELFTGKNLQGGTIGIAWSCGDNAPPDCGLICSFSAFSVVQIFGGLASQTDLSAHELGHNWGRPHCSCTQHTMNPFLVTANKFHPVFSIPGLILHRETLLDCLDSLAPPISFPFSETFDGPQIDPLAWYNSGATIDDQGDGEPSGTTSLRINGSDIITSGSAGVPASTGVTYWHQSGGNTPGGPGFGEDMLIEYVTDSRVWAEADRVLGSASDSLPYQQGCFLIPNDANLGRFQVRVRLLNAEGSDNYFIDDFAFAPTSELLAAEPDPILDCACQGGGAELGVVTSGIGPFTFQWKLDGEPVSGATSQTLVINPVGPEDYGIYTVDVSNVCGTVESASIPMLEDSAIEFTQQPQDTTVQPGQTLALFTAANGGCNTFQWFFNDEPIPDTDAPFLFLPDMECAHQGCYQVQAANECGTALSETAIVTVGGCGPVSCGADAAPPEIVHAAGLLGETRPYSGHIDPLNESSNGVDLDRGITQIDILFSEPVEDLGGGDLSANAFVVTETGGGAPPSIASVNTEGMPLVALTLDRPIALQEYTTIQAVVQDLADVPNVIVDAGNQGPGVDETDRVDLGFLPADIDQSGLVNPLDLLTFKQFVNGVQTPQRGTIEDFIDTNRSGGINPLDLLAFKQLINGVIPPSTRTWAFESMNNARP